MAQKMPGPLHTTHKQPHLPLAPPPFVEPKSGTTTSGIWALRGLFNTCLFLQSLYGKRSCHTEKAKDVSQYKIVFTPQLNEDDAPCACDGVKR